MVDTFAPQFFLLIGVDLFLGASIMTVMLEKYFPTPTPYIMDVAGFIGFAQLLIGPEYLAAFSSSLQFYYGFGYSLVAVMSIIGLNLYLLFIKRTRYLSSVFAIVGSIPSILIVLFFSSAYVNGIPIQLPVIPTVSIQTIYVMFFASASLIVLSIIVSVYTARRANGSKQFGARKHEPVSPS